MGQQWARMKALVFQTQPKARLRWRTPAATWRKRPRKRLQQRRSHHPGMTLKGKHRTLRQPDRLHLTLSYEGQGIPHTVLHSPEERMAILLQFTLRGERKGY